MKTLYVECNMGAAGDMLMAALSELLPEEDNFVAEINDIGINGVEIKKNPAMKCGISGTHIQVLIGENKVEEGEHPHSHSHVHTHSHEHGDNHEHAHSHEHSDAQEHPHDCSEAYEHIHSHEHGDNHEHAHSHDHGDSHTHLHNHEHIHSHEHGDNHEHAHSHDHGDSHTHPHSHEQVHNHEHGDVHVHNHQNGDGHIHSHNHPHSHADTHDHKTDHAHNGFQDIQNIIGNSKASDNAKAHALEVYRLLAEAEGHVHRKEMDQIHFHEVGTMDAVADILGVCMLIDRISPDCIIVSPIHVGSGHVHCAHGILPVPAPATAKLLEGIPIYSSGIKGELCTPTGAAILKYFADEFGPMPVMKLEKTGYGMGKKDFEMANCVRVFLGEQL